MPEKKSDLPEEVHQRLRVKAAMLDMSMQAFVADVVLPRFKESKHRD